MSVTRSLRCGAKNARERMEVILVPMAKGWGSGNWCSSYLPIFRAAPCCALNERSYLCLNVFLPRQLRSALFPARGRCVELRAGGPFFVFDFVLIGHYLIPLSDCPTFYSLEFCGSDDNMKSAKRRLFTFMEYSSRFSLLILYLLIWQAVFYNN